MDSCCSGDEENRPSIGDNRGNHENAWIRTAPVVINKNRALIDGKILTVRRKLTDISRGNQFQIYAAVSQLRLAWAASLLLNPQHSPLSLSLKKHRSLKLNDNSKPFNRISNCIEYIATYVPYY